MESYNSFRVAQQQVLEAAKLLHLDEATVQLLIWPQKEVKFTLHVRMDNGKVNIYHAYRIQHNYARGPPKEASVSIPTRPWIRSAPSRRG